MATDDIRHVHIGAGKMGLGLVGELTQESGFSTTFLSRAGSFNEHIYEKLREDSEYVIKLGHEGRSVTISQHSFMTYAPEDLDSESNKAAIETLASATS